MNNMSMGSVVNKYKVSQKLKKIALFSRLHYIIFGGLLAALGVLSMHYLGMMAQRSHAELTLMTEFVAISCVIAFVTANAAFWILFRVVRHSVCYCQSLTTSYYHS